MLRPWSGALLLVVGPCFAAPFRSHADSRPPTPPTNRTAGTPNFGGVRLPFFDSGRGVKAALRTLSSQFNYKAGIPEVPAGTKILDVWIPVPSDNPYQTIGQIKIDGPGNPQLN